MLHVQRREVCRLRGQIRAVLGTGVPSLPPCSSFCVADEHKGRARGLPVADSIAMLLKLAYSACEFPVMHALRKYAVEVQDCWLASGPR